MAKCTMQMPDDFLKKLSKLGSRTDEITERVLEAGGEVVLDKVKGNLSAVVGKGTKYESRSTGELVRALGLSSMNVDADGNPNVKVGFAEPHSSGVSNAKLASILEYGKHGQPPKPFLKPAQTASKADCISTMSRKLQEEIDKL